MTTYRGKLTLRLAYSINGGPVNTYLREVGQLPVMVKSNQCNLRNLTSAGLVRHGEESDEMGGYFVVNGNEKLIRFLIVPRRNHVTSLIRPSFKNRGPAYSQFGVSIRCVRKDQTSHTNTLHYLEDGNVMMRFSWRKNEYLVPVMMIIKALVGASDRQVFEGLMQGDMQNTFLTDRVELLLRGYKTFALYTQEQCLAYLGDKFRVVLNTDEDKTDEEVGKYLLDRIILVHLGHRDDKYRLLLLMIRQLYSLVAGEASADNPDSPQHQEILLGGFLYGMILKEKVEDFLTGIKYQIQQDLRRNVGGVDFLNTKYFTKTVMKVPADIGSKLSYFLATGNLVSKTGLDLQQASGYTIVAEKLNFYRYLSHFRCVHRGAFFAELKTTTVRKLLPEAWGFLCPVHTPDGAPCGLLNHLSHTCDIVTSVLNVQSIPSLLASLGLTQSFTPKVSGREQLPVMLDGQVMGYGNAELLEQIAYALRTWKVARTHGIPMDMEIGHVPPSKGGQYPGLFLFSTPARMMRPVRHVSTQKEDHVGSFEQVYMDIACMEDEVSKTTSHQEFTPTNVLSIVANLTPFSDFNQSPRNMYQCQMGKQTMGTPSSALAHRTDNKMYRLQTGQTPIVRPIKMHEQYGIDHFPGGTNAVVAVISYTGYDMEDAMILNKSAHERGFGYGSIYKSELVDLGAMRRRGEPIMHHFGLGQDASPQVQAYIDIDGMPHIGVHLTEGSPMYAYIDETSGKTIVKRYKGTEDAYVDQVRVLGSDAGDSEAQRIHIKLRIPRSPVIGDKFSSRHGQKGVCSQKWPAVDMPFSESGIQPDVIINPHAFPSRMTIGMFVESMAGKAGALNGAAQDSTPFTFSESSTPIDYFGKELAKNGYNYYGNEAMYSGITGREFEADIYIGVVYYQRLRHMVSDKYQVRTTGPVHTLTHQPIKGRKKGGGIRFGEMERDALIAHGTSFLLQDRLMNCSDISYADICRRCGSIISSILNPDVVGGVQCLVCKEKGVMDVVTIPYVFRYLLTELASMGVQVSCAVKP